VQEKTELVTFFPDWRGDPYLDDLGSALAEQGWRYALVGRKGLMLALFAAMRGRGTVHLHWFEAFTPRRNRLDGLVAWLYLPALWLAGRRGRVIWTVHNVTPHEGYAPLVGTSFLRRLARSSSRILVHFDQTREAVEAKFSTAGKTFVTHAASFGHAHGPPIGRAEARASISGSLTEDTTLFVQVGSLRAYKQPATTAQAFRDTAPPTAMLLIAGPCEDESIEAEVVRAAANDPRIVLQFGRLPNEKLVAALCAADWSICPYLRIDNPGAVNLSVSYGCPVIAPNLSQVRELTIGHPAILYPVDGSAREQLGGAIATAATRTRSPVAEGAARPAVTRREQARQTSEHYLAARTSSRSRRRST
jgi:glycosyltransferase involved in cell wall biosynthesis